MNTIVCVASATPERMETAIIEIGRALLSNTKLLLITNYNYSDSWSRMIDRMITSGRAILREGSSQRQHYNEIIKAKVDFIGEYANDDSIVCLWDDDYAYNSMILDVAERLFTENPEVNYASFLRGAGLQGLEEVLSGWKFIRWASCMGGSTIVRWAVFKEHVGEYLRQCGLTGKFDCQCKIDGVFGQSFWIFLEKQYGLKNQVWTLSWPFSLQQHCRMGGSLYGHDVSGNHTYGVNFDPITDPFLWRAK